VPFNTYRVTFRYRILVTPDRGFETLFYSPTGGHVGDFLPSTTISGNAGESGTRTLTNTLGKYGDYEVRWNVVGTGAISIDDIVNADFVLDVLEGADGAVGCAFDVVDDDEIDRIVGWAMGALISTGSVIWELVAVVGFGRRDNAVHRSGIIGVLVGATASWQLRRGCI